MPFQDLDELLGSSKKELPIGGRLVAFPTRISAETGLIILRLSERARANPAAAVDGDALLAEVIEEFPDDAWVRAQRDLLGRDPQELMLAEALSVEGLAHVTKTLVAWHLQGREAAEKAWSQVGNPQAPNRQTRRASKAPAKSSRSRGSRAGSTTPPPVDSATDRPGVNSSPTGD